jgi:hypothetical protein
MKKNRCSRWLRPARLAQRWPNLPSPCSAWSTPPSPTRKGSGDGSAHKAQLTNSGNMFSRLGFRGTEDLGGGYSANFWLEMGLQNDSATGLSLQLEQPGQRQRHRGRAELQPPLHREPRGPLRRSCGWAATTCRPSGTPPSSTPSARAAASAPTRSISPAWAGWSRPPARAPPTASATCCRPASGGFYGQVMYAMGENDSNSVLPNTPVPNRHDGDHTGARFGYQSGGHQHRAGHRPHALRERRPARDQPRRGLHLRTPRS